jgi:hypothetical protein
MTIEQILAIISIFIAVCAPVGQVLFERHLARRDARRIEGKSKAKPEPTKFARNLVRVGIFALPASALAYEVLLPDPVNRMAVFAISLCVASLLSLVVFEFFRAVILKLLVVHENTNKVQLDILATQSRLSDSQMEHLEITRRVAAVARRAQSSRRPKKSKASTGGARGA